MEARVSPGFKYAFFGLLGLTVIFLLLALAISVFITHPTSGQSAAAKWLFGAASSAFSALLGLLGGKVA